MKKNIPFFFLTIMLFSGMLRAQDPISLPNGSFEQWTSHPGYDVTVVFLPIQVYDTFSTPSNWDYPSYPVNETVSVMGMNININTSVPIVKTTPETGVVPDGNKAVKLQTIMLDDIINPTVLSLAGDFLDSTLTQQAIPSILSTGEIDINAFIPLISDLMSGSSDIISLLPTLLTMDVNDYIAGGIALGDFKPSHLSGSYKYHSATSGDNGGVLLLGTRYNNVTHHREVVGGGISLDLVDADVYTPFETEYVPLSAFIPGETNASPDSLIVILLSSAGNNIQQGSYLCIDNLMLWPAPDTCASIQNLTLINTVYDAFPEMALEWYSNPVPDYWEIEYGPHGFQVGNGTIVETNTPYFSIYELEDANMLQPNTLYTFYIRSVCGDSTYGDWDSIHYRTPCATVGELTVNGNSEDLLFTEDNKVAGFSISWVDTTDTQSWGIYYGIYNPNLPDNWGTYVVVDTPYFEFPPLRPEKTYTVEVSARCAEDNYGEPRLISFSTPHIEGICKPNPHDQKNMVNVYPNPAKGQCNVTIADGSPANLRLYSVDGRLIQSIATDGSPVVLSLPWHGLFILHATTSTGSSIQKITNQ
ncbi:MAG: T9SS type A sorting domain-containing protein [Bacteroidales bacterium]|nr:T9SS type A sorting domain-containing protein [Bacteroidales bacterium]